MTIKYEPEHDILNIEFLAGVEIADSVERDGVIFDYTEDRRVAAIEILDVSRRMDKDISNAINVSIVTHGKE